MQVPHPTDLPEVTCCSTPSFVIHGGVCNTSLRCRTRSGLSHRLERFMTLELEMLPGHPKITQQQFVDNHSVSHASNDVGCTTGRCNDTQPHDSRLNIVQWPRPPVVHSKRWRFDEHTFTHTGTSGSMSFPTSYRPNTPTTDTLRSMIIHRGQAGGGHYVRIIHRDAHGWLLCGYSNAPVNVNTSEIRKARSVHVLRAYRTQSPEGKQKHNIAEKTTTSDKPQFRVKRSNAYETDR